MPGISCLSITNDVSASRSSSKRSENGRRGVITISDSTTVFKPFGPIMSTSSVRSALPIESNSPGSPEI